MKTLGAIFLCLAFSFNHMNVLAKTDTGKLPDKGETLYREAEEKEWLKDNNMKEIDSLYDKAALKGSDKAYMARAITRLFMTDHDSQAHKKLAGEVCPKMAEIAARWQAGNKRDADELFQMARYYSLPWCKNRDLAKTAALLAQAAEMGNVKAQYFMGRMLQKKDPKAAFGWYEKAASGGFPQAMAHQGLCYLLGSGTDKDEKKGMELIGKAMGSRNPNTLYDIAIWHLEGLGLPKDVARAEKILKELAAKDYEPALLPLKDIEQAKNK